MKKILLLLILTILAGCQDDPLYQYDKQNPHQLNIALCFTPEEVVLLDENDVYTLDWTYEDAQLIIRSETLNCFIAGEYRINITDSKNTLSVKLEISGFNQNIPSLLKEELFEKPTSFLVFFSKANCYGCELIMADIYRYHDAQTARNHEPLLPIWQIKYEDNHNASLFGPVESVLGVSKLSDLQIPSVPTLLLIKNHIVVAYYHGASEVLNYLNTLK
ncbi:MAG TPA: hypothetical protein PK087_00110 [Bacilli bacterium]|nr:MAG: hypothetical protein BWY97_00831 [Tenericutes bacterium ADurb.BinA124]HNZ49891.1 hypothetical protein [Bacilli bacterium]HOH17701.1 hypothetical protein [Bacilli bacterium]HPN61401.1 hypothetical protein [Bacilli bacterium]HPX84237.1 hypothetical protein [Bacilli bacterium]